MASRISSASARSASPTAAPPTTGPNRATTGTRGISAMTKALKSHWPEYLIEATGLGLFMISACFFTALFEHPASAVHHAFRDPVLRRILNGIAMGLTAIGIIYSPWGKQSGAHINPSVTLAFWRLG